MKAVAAKAIPKIYATGESGPGVVAQIRQALREHITKQLNGIDEDTLGQLLLVGGRVAFMFEIQHHQLVQPSRFGVRIDVEGMRVEDGKAS